MLSVLCSITVYEPRIDGSGGKEYKNFQYTKLINSLSKFMKKGSINGCCDKKGETFDLP